MTIKLRNDIPLIDELVLAEWQPPHTLVIAPRVYRDLRRYFGVTLRAGKHRKHVKFEGNRWKVRAV